MRTVERSFNPKQTCVLVESTPVGSPRELSPGAKVVRTLQFIDTGSLSRVTSIEEKLSSVLALEPSTLKQQFEDLVFELPENDDSEVLEKLAHAEQKIIELQQEILKLERSLFLVNQNCAKKNHVLKNATNMLSTAKTLFLDENEKNKIKIMQEGMTTFFLIFYMTFYFFHPYKAR